MLNEEPGESGFKSRHHRKAGPAFALLAIQNFVIPKKLCILIVEDHQDTRETLASLLTVLGHRVESCPDSETALARLSHDGLDVLLTDVRLPGAAAWDYLAELSKRGKMPPCVISMSAVDDLNYRKKSEQAGCLGHLVKPFTTNELEVLLSAL